MKGKILKKLKTIRPADYLKQDRVLQIKALNGYVESFTNSSSFNLKDLVVSQENEPRKAEVQECEVIDVSQQMRDLEEGYSDDKENTGPPCLRSKEQDTSRSSKPPPLAEIDISSFRRPDMNSESLFDPLLLAAFEQAVKEHVELRKSAEKIEFFEERVEEKEEREEEEELPWKLLEVFEEKCPPGGNDSVILYTTTLRGIRKTFEDCNKIRFLLDSFKVVYIERDTSMHMKFKEELWNILDGKPLPPRLFVKGRYIGGAEEVLNLHEQGRFKPLLAEIPLRNSNTSCEGCDGVRFMICFSCNGSQRIIKEEDDEEKQSNQCSDCNENGLVICPYCCS
ncbi:uncharacterized protein At3g28850-like [Neltuma alba]|uniref:uncharacterized protein At3g28850-like n=1 Tax=Neltuma alba TaxID=207710 RepID=UPI0010A35CA7|nr:uncharacterized protein At3g28850-like [Prosopis alba]